MLERESELQLLTTAAERVRRAEGGVVLVAGEAGIGKSTLLDAFVAGLEDDLRVLRGWCDDLVTANPLGPIREAVRGRRGSLAVTPELDAALAEGDVARALDAVSTAFGCTRTVAVIEDLQWADDATLDVLGYLARRLDKLRLLLVCSLRPEESASLALRRFLGGLPARDTVRIELPPLSREAVAELNSSGRWDTDKLLQVTGGNPFYVTEALAAAPDGEVPPTVTDAVLVRLHRSSPECRRALETLSAWSGELPHELAEAVLGDDVEALAEAETRGLVTADADGIRFRHEVARRVTEDTLPLVRRRAIDRHLVEVLSMQADDIPRLLHHAIRCGDGPTIARYAPEAGDYSARVGANRQAIAYFAAALQYEQLLTPRDLAGVCDSYAWVLHIAHRFGEAVTQGRRAARLWSELGDRRAEAASLRRLARELTMAGEPEEALPCVERALALAADFDAEARAASLGALGSHYAITGDPRGVELLLQARQLVGAGALPAPTRCASTIWPMRSPASPPTSAWHCFARASPRASASRRSRRPRAAGPT